MIQINLLPEEYRRADQTPLPMFLTIVFGIITVGSLGAWWLTLANSFQNVKSENIRLQGEQKKWKEEADEVNDIIKKIKTMEKRQDTILDISRSKIMWSQKLFQLSSIFTEFDGFWVETVSMSQKSLKGQLTLSCNALGRNYTRVANFRDRLRKDTTFWYHFSEIKNERIGLKEATDDGEPERLQFTLSLLLREAPVAKKGKP